MFSLIFKGHIIRNASPLAGLLLSKPGPDKMTADNPLDALRREIDGIDDAIHDLLMRRSEVAERIRLAKPSGGINLRPGREADVLRRLVARHKGRFPKPTLVRLWREIFSAAVAQQGPFSMAVYRPEGVDGYVELARDQYGSFTPLTGHLTDHQVIEAVTSGRATAGILPLPQPDDRNPWWPHLVGSGADAPRIVARLPFTGMATSRNRDLQALVISRVAQENTGRDRTFVALDAEEKVDLAPLRRAFEKAKMKADIVSLWSDGGRKAPWLHLAEVEGFVAPDDPRLKAVVAAAGETAQRAIVLGGYAVPFSADELSSAPARSAPQPRKAS
jgi:chorismate mutase/prephenate dehydratase